MHNMKGDHPQACLTDVKHEHLNATSWRCSPEEAVQYSQQAHGRCKLQEHGCKSQALCKGCKPGHIKRASLFQQHLSCGLHQQYSGLLAPVSIAVTILAIFVRSSCRA